MLCQQMVPVALSGAMGRGMPVPVVPQYVRWDCVSVAVCLPGAGGLRALPCVSGKR